MRNAPNSGMRFSIIVFLLLLLPSAFCHSPTSNHDTTDRGAQSSEKQVGSGDQMPMAVAALYYHCRDDSGRIDAGVWDDGEVVLADFGPRECEVTVTCFRISDQQVAELKRRLKFARLRSMLHKGDPFDPRAGNWVMLNHSDKRVYWKWDEVFLPWPVVEGQSYRCEVYMDAWSKTDAAIKESIRDQQPTRVFKVSNEEWKQGFDPIRLTKPNILMKDIDDNQNE